MSRFCFCLCVIVSRLRRAATAAPQGEHGLPSGALGAALPRVCDTECALTKCRAFAARDRDDSGRARQVACAEDEGERLCLFSGSSWPRDEPGTCSIRPSQPQPKPQRNRSSSCAISRLDTLAAAQIRRVEGALCLCPAGRLNTKSKRPRPHSAGACGTAPYQENQSKRRGPFSFIFI